MSKIKTLKNEPENCINIIDVLSLITPEGKSKYVETLIRIMKKTHRLKDYGEEVRQILYKNFQIDIKKLEDFTDVQILLVYKFLNDFFNQNDLANFKKFCELNERGLVEKKDLSSYNSFNEITDQLTISEMKLIEKEMEKQVIKIHQDDEWVVVRPLTYESSKRYGSNTKWCTTHEREDSYFRKYAGTGILLYMINKKTGLKVACFRSIRDYEFSFWNQMDHRIDSLQSNLPNYIIDIIKKEIETNFISNLTLNGEIYTEDKEIRALYVTDQVEEPAPQQEIDIEEPIAEENVLGRELVGTYGFTRDMDQISNNLIETIHRQLEIPFPDTLNTNNRA
jgi:hypothetical protein